MKCPRCGEEGEGRYCARCGTRLAEEGRMTCPSCGTPASSEALYCTECGEPLRERPEKGARQYLPWALSGLALVAFAVAIAFWVQSQSSPRAPGAPPTGGVISGGSGMMAGENPEERGGPMGGGPGGATQEGAAGGGMPSAQELAQMPPREAADRLYNRAMSLREQGDPEGRAAFFARMGVRAYQRVPAAERDADMRFHLGLLHLVREDVAAAAAQADSILSADADHLLGLMLAARAAEAGGDTGAAERWRDSLAAAARAADLDGRPAYRAHRDLIEEAAGIGGG